MFYHFHRFFSRYLAFDHENIKYTVVFQGIRSRETLARIGSDQILSTAILYKIIVLHHLFFISLRLTLRSQQKLRII